MILISRINILVSRYVVYWSLLPLTRTLTRALQHLTCLRVPSLMSDSGSHGKMNEQKRIPLMISNLLDVAVYSFGSMKGLREDHRVQSTEVVDGVCLMFGNLVANAKKEVQDEFELLGPRFGGWKPKQPPTRELFTFVQSRLKKWKKKNGFRKTSDPMMAPALIHFSDSDEEMENGTPKCWRCSTLCKNCCSDKQGISFFADLAKPYLEALDAILDEEEGELEEEEDDDEEVEDEDEDDGEETSSDDEELYENLLENISESDLE